MTARDHMIARVQQMPTTEIIELLNAATRLVTPEAYITVEVVLQVLELRLPEAQFIDLCDKIAAAPTTTHHTPLPSPHTIPTTWSPQCSQSMSYGVSTDQAT